MDILCWRRAAWKAITIRTERKRKQIWLFKQEFAGRTSVTLADPSDVAKVLRNGSKYPQRFRFPILDYYREKRQKIPGVFFADGPEWYKHRSVLSKRMLRAKEVADYASVLNEIISDFIHRLRTVRQPDRSKKGSITSRSNGRLSLLQNDDVV